jgi:hypothetical protein
VTPAPVAPAPVTPPAATAPTTTTKTTTTRKAPATPATPPATPSTPPASSGGGGGGGGGSSSTPSESTPTTTDKAPSTPAPDKTGPVVFASGQGTIYDPNGVAKDKGEEGNAIDGSSSTSWTVTLNDGQTGGLGYVLDFDDPAAVKTLKVRTSTAGLKIKVLATTKTALPADELDANWDTVAADKTMKSGQNSISLKAVSGAKSKYRHVLVLFTEVPGTPAKAVIREFSAST